MYILSTLKIIQFYYFNVMLKLHLAPLVKTDSLRVTVTGFFKIVVKLCSNQFGLQLHKVGDFVSPKETRGQ